jgi:hypothetical protein
VGVPNGLVSVLPSLGMLTRRVGFAFPVNLNLPTRLIGCFGVRALTPSTPAVFLPWLSYVTRRTAIHFADPDLIRVF